MNTTPEHPIESVTPQMPEGLRAELFSDTLPLGILERGTATPSERFRIVRLIDNLRAWVEAAQIGSP